MSRAHRPPPPRRSLSTLADLQLDAQNANRGTSRGRTLLAESLRAHGAGRSILVDREGRVIAGNKTVEQAQQLGLPIRVVETTGEELVVVHRTDLDLATDARARRLALADNRVAELDLDWDPDLLKQHRADGVPLDDLWTPDELEQLLGEGIHAGATEENATVEPRATDIRRGDLFALGPHRLLCGDATDPADVTRLLAGATPPLMATDPPYGVDYDPAWRHRADPSQATAVGRVRNDDRSDWTAAYRLFPGAVAYLWHAGVHAGRVAASLEDAGFAIRAQLIWVKSHFAMGRGHFHWQHEPAYYAVRTGRSARWRGDRTQSTVWTVPNSNPFGGERTGENAVTGHSTQKPVRLFERAVLNHTEAGEAVYDPFLGSGTTLIAAQKTGRMCYALELEPTYVQATIDRWEAYAGARARRETRRRGARS